MSEGKREIATTLAALVNALPALERTAKLKLPVKSAYHLAKLTKLVHAEAKLYFEQRDRQIKELGEERDPTPMEARQNGGEKVTEVTPANRPEYFRRLEELGNQAVTIAWGPVDLEAIAGLDIPAEDVLLLGALVGLEELAATSPTTTEKVAAPAP